MAMPKLGYLCLCENPTAEDGRALIRQFVLVREADRMGYDDIWIGEHHDDRAWPGSAIGPLLGHLAAVTSKARIGAMVLQPGSRDAKALAEEVATLDLLSKGRFELGVAGPPGLLTDRMAAVQALLADATLVPRPQQPQVPVWVASGHPATLQHAAQAGWGLMAAATHTLARVQAARAAYEATAGRSPALVLARFGCAAATREEAEAIARPYFTSLVERAHAAGWGGDPAGSVARDVQALVDQSLVGSYAEVAAQFKQLGETWGAQRVAVVPTSAQFDTHKHILADFVDEVRPLLDD